MNFLVYIIYNKDFDKFYIGQTDNIIRRLEEHKLGKVNYTSKCPGEWMLVYEEIFPNQTEALKRERFLKRQKNKNFYKKLCNII